MKQNNKLKIAGGCLHTYSRSMNQTYPRKCALCGNLEEKSGTWICPICKKSFLQEKKKEHIALEIKEFKEALKILRSL